MYPAIILCKHLKIKKQNKMNKLIFSISIIAIIAITACGKENDAENPVITITSPTEGQMIMSDSVLVAFTVIDADMHGYEYLLINTTSGDTLYEADEHTHGNVTFSDNFAVPTPAQFTLEVVGEDHNGNTSTKSVNFHTM